MRGERFPPEDIVVVALDEESADRLKLSRDIEQWPRSYYARLIHRLAEAGASVIAFDVIFNERRSLSADSDLAAAIHEAGNVILLAQLEKETVLLRDTPQSAGNKLIIEAMTPPISVLEHEALYVAPFPLPKVPGRVSQYWAFKQTADVPTLPAAALQVYALQSFDVFVSLLKRALSDNEIKEATDAADRSARDAASWLAGLDRADIKDADVVTRLIRSMKTIFGSDTVVGRRLVQDLNDSTAQWPQSSQREILKAIADMYRSDASRYLNFYGPPRTITTVPFYKIVQGSTAETDVMHDLRNKAVFVGVSDVKPYKAGDTYSTVYSTENGLDLSGVEIAATAFANLLERRTVQPLRFGFYVLVVALFGVVAGTICYLFGPMFSALAVVGLGSTYLAGAYWQFTHADIWYPVIVPLAVQAPTAFVFAVLWKYLGTRKLEMAHEQLKEVDRLKSMFLSHVSHELKTPLTSIKGFVDNMMSGLTGELGEKQHDYLRRIRANTDRLARMIANLLDVSRIESGTQQLELMPVNVYDLVQESVMQFQLISATKGVTLGVVCEDPMLRVQADSDKFIQVITNLVDNAIKFTPAGGRITVEVTRQAPDQVVVTVVDTGEGIPQKDLQKLFEPFYQTKRAAMHAKGLGLGLSIVKHLVELHRGTVSVTSEPGEGSIFRVVLPALTRQETSS